MYEEPLNQTIMENAITAIEKADTLIVGGTSLTVYPAAGLIDYFSGKNLILINKTPTPQNKYATLVIIDSLGKVFSHL